MLCWGTDVKHSCALVTVLTIGERHMVAVLTQDPSYVILIRWSLCAVHGARYQQEGAI